MKWFKRDLEPGMNGVDVAIVQRRIGVLATGTYDEETTARIRGVQLVNGLEVTGMVNKKTAEKLGEDAPDENPGWYTSPIDSMFREGEDVRAARQGLGLGDRDNRWDADAEAACRRFQGTHGLPVTGFVDEATARALG